MIFLFYIIVVYDIVGTREMRFCHIQVATGGPKVRVCDRGRGRPKVAESSSMKQAILDSGLLGWIQAQIRQRCDTIL